MALAVAATAVAPAVVGATEDAPVTVTAAPITNVRDGDAVTIKIKTSGDYSAVSAEARLCRLGPNYQPSTARSSPDDAKQGGPNCPATPISSSADASASAPVSLPTDAASSDGGSFTLKVGAGVVNWKGSDGTDYSLTCDEKNPCALVVEVRSGPSGSAPTWTPTVFNVTYRTSDPIAGCGGPAEGALSSAGSDRMFDLWVDLTLAKCEGNTSGAPTGASFTGEADAVTSFADGLTDIAYTGLGYGDGTDFVEGEAADKTTRRGEVMVPIALNAVVLAVGNGYQDPNTGHKAPYSDVKLTLDEVATLVSGGIYAMDPYLDAIYARNPQLKSSGFFDTNSDFKVGGPAGGDAGTWIATSALTALRPDQWKVPNQGTFRAEAGKQRGANASLATANPSFQNALSLFSGRPVLQRSLNSLGASDFGGVYVLTDLATALSFHLTPVQIENGKGNFVAPTPASITAAVPFMKKTGNGTLLPDPSATADSGEQPYPLAFVEYAMAPAEPLHTLAPACAARTASQALLKDWLAFVTGPGQSKLTKGFVPLTAGLASTAADALPKVGAAPLSGDCVTTAATADGTLTLTPIAAAPTDASAGGADNSAATAEALDGMLADIGLPSTVAPRTTSPAITITTAKPSNPVARAAAALIRPVRAILDPRRVGQFWPTVALLAVLGLITFAVRLSARSKTWQLF